MTEQAPPTRSDAILFGLRATGLRLRRVVAEAKGAPRRLARGGFGPNSRVVAEIRTPLRTSRTSAEFALERGKIENLRIAARELDGTIIPAGEVFSFWRNLGRASRRRGFVPGRELRAGCVIPSVGGGLCQLSNALFELALRTGCQIVERHAHSHRVAGSQTAAQRDATVFWNYVDLRFAPTADCQLRVVLTRDYLVVALHGSGPEQMPPDVQLSRSAADPDIRNAAESCETCGVTECFRHSTAADLPRTGGVTWLVDRFEPEFDRWIQHHRQPEDVLIMPVAPGIAPAQYLWSSEGFRKVHAAPLATLRRSLISRRLAAQGAERQRMLLKLDHALAAVFVRNIPFTCDHVVVSQNLLPQLWRSGVLGGRTFDVLMTRSPIAHLERVLDEAAAAHPTSRTLADFRAPAELRETETEALAAARCWVTPHSGIAELAGPRSIKLPWATPAAREMPKGDRNLIVFPSSTLARKGCYELREAARELGLKIHFVGQVLETDGFWTGQGVALHGDGWMAMAAAVVLPAWVEHWPRRLLRAAAAGVPVIASSACGLNGIRNLQECSPGDAGTLRDLLAGVLGGIPA